MECIVSIYTYDPYLSNDVVEIGQLKDFVLKIGLNPTVLADKNMEFRICVFSILHMMGMSSICRSLLTWDIAIVVREVVQTFIVSLQVVRIRLCKCWQLIQPK